MKKNICLIIITILVISLFAQLESDSLETLLKESSGKERIKLLNKISGILWDEDPEKGIKYANEALTLVPEYGDSLDKAIGLGSLGINYWALNRNDEAEHYYLKALDLFLALGDMFQIAGIYTNLALIYNYKNQFDKAIEYQLKCLQIQEENNFRKGMINATNNLALIYSSQGSYEEALPYFIKSLEIQEELNLLDNKSYSLINIGAMYLHLGKYDKAKEYFDQSLEIDRKNNNSWGISYNLYNMSEIDIINNDLDKAMEKLNESLKIREEFGNPRVIVETLIRLTSVLLDKGDFAEALFNLKKTEKLVLDNELNQQLIYLKEVYGKYYEMKGMYKEALTELREMYVIKDSIFSIENAQKMNELKTKYEVVKKERENEILRKNNKIQALELEKNQMMQLYYKIILLIGFLLIFVIFLNLKNKTKANKLLKEKNTLIEKQKIKISESYDKLMELIKSKDKFISIMAHDIKNPLVAQISGSKILIRHAEATGNEDVLLIAQEMQRNIVHLISLLENLLQWSVIQNGRMKYNPKKINLQDIIIRSTQLYQMKASLKEITIENGVADNTMIFADRDMLISIVNNLLTNAIKFSYPKGIIEIKSTEDDEKIGLSIKDHGIGMSKEKKDELFRLDINPSTSGTLHEKGTGLGLILTKEFIEKNGGQYIINSTLEEGTEIIINFPKCR